MHGVAADALHKLFTSILLYFVSLYLFLKALSHRFRSKMCKVTASAGSWNQGIIAHQATYFRWPTKHVNDKAVWVFRLGATGSIEFAGRGRSWIMGLAGIAGLGLVTIIATLGVLWASRRPGPQDAQRRVAIIVTRLGPNSEPRGNNRSFPETRERTRAPVKKIGSRDLIFGLVNSTYFFKITNHNQHAFNIKYLANLIKKYWTCFRCQKLADFLVCFPGLGSNTYLYLQIQIQIQIRRICICIWSHFKPCICICIWSTVFGVFDKYVFKYTFSWAVF